MSTWWIDEPFLLGSSNPSEAHLQNLYRQGFRIIIALLDDTEQPPRYDSRHTIALGFKRYSILIPDFGAPSLDQVYKFIDWLAAVPRVEKVLVHCEGEPAGPGQWPQHTGLRKVHPPLMPFIRSGRQIRMQ